MDEWEAAIGEELKWKREKQNAKDTYTYAVAVRKNVVASYVHRKLSRRICALFIKRKGKNCCQVVGRC